MAKNGNTIPIIDKKAPIFVLKQKSKTSLSFDTTHSSHIERKMSTQDPNMTKQTLIRVIHTTT